LRIEDFRPTPRLHRVGSPLHPQANVIPLEVPFRVSWNSLPNTSFVSVRVGRSTTTREYPSHHASTWVLRGTTVPSDCLSQRWMKLFHPSFGFSDWTLLYESSLITSSCRLHPRGQVIRRESKILVITELGDFPPTPHTRLEPL
jgi:hypothetical protein